MKITINLPDALFRRAKAAAAAEGKSLKVLFAETLQPYLHRRAVPIKPWMKGFGGMRHLHHENLRIDRLIAEEFGAIDQEQWR